MSDDSVDPGGNVFADLGFRDADQELLRAKLILEIHLRLKQRNLGQAEVAKLLGTTQPQVSALMRLKPVSISVGRLMEFLTILGQDIEISVKPSLHADSGRISFRSTEQAA